MLDNYLSKIKLLVDMVEEFSKDPEVSEEVLCVAAMKDIRILTNKEVTRVKDTFGAKNV